MPKRSCWRWTLEVACWKLTPFSSRHVVFASLFLTQDPCRRLHRLRVQNLPPIRRSPTNQSIQLICRRIYHSRQRAEGALRRIWLAGLVVPVRLGELYGYLWTLFSASLSNSARKVIATWWIGSSVWRHNCGKVRMCT